MFKKDKKGFLSIIDGIFAIFLLIIVFSLFTSIINIPTTDYNFYSNDFKDSQDIMELLSNKIYFKDQSILEKAESILKSNNNSKNSINEVAILIDDTFKKIPISSNYLFSEINYLKGETIASNGEINNAQNISVAIRNVGDYSFILYLW